MNKHEIIDIYGKVNNSIEIEFEFNKKLDIVKTSAIGGTTTDASCFF